MSICTSFPIADFDQMQANEERSWFNTGHMTSHTHKVLAAELEKWLNEQ